MRLRGSHSTGRGQQQDRAGAQTVLVTEEAKDKATATCTSPGTCVLAAATGPLGCPAQMHTRSADCTCPQGGITDPELLLASRKRESPSGPPQGAGYTTFKDKITPVHPRERQTKRGGAGGSECARRSL